MEPVNKHVVRYTLFHAAGDSPHLPVLYVSVLGQGNTDGSPYLQVHCNTFYDIPPVVRSGIRQSRQYL
jgi:hypothetical protein